MELLGRTIKDGKATGVAIVTSQPISFFGGVDPERGVVTEKGHELDGQAFAGKILVFPTGKGSTVGSYALYRLKKKGFAPAGIINKDCETIIAVGAIISEIPCVDHIDVTKIKSGDVIHLEGNKVVFNE